MFNCDLSCSKDALASNSVSTVAAVIPTYNRWVKTQRFLAHFTRQSYTKLAIIVVDASSPDGSAARVRNEYPTVTVLETDSTQYWAGATNVGVLYALEQGYDYIFTINDDAVVACDHVQRLILIAEGHQLSILGNRIDYLNVPGKIWALGTQLVWGTSHFLRLQYADVMASDLPAEILAKEAVAVDTLPGDGVLIHRQVFEKVGLYQSKFLPHYHADSELVLRAKRWGFQAYVTPQVVLQDDFSIEQKRLEFNNLAGLQYAFFNPKSHLYLSAIAYIFLRYCPVCAYPKTAYSLLQRLLRLRKRSLGSKRPRR